MYYLTVVCPNLSFHIFNHVHTLSHTKVSARCQKKSYRVNFAMHSIANKRINSGFYLVLFLPSPRMIQEVCAKQMMTLLTTLNVIKNKNKSLKSG